MKKKLTLLLFVLFISVIIKAAYFRNLPYSITQPNGVLINCFVSGDEFYNWIHDSEGFTIIQSSDGFYYYAIQDGDLVKPSSHLVHKVNPSRVGLNKWVKVSLSEYSRRKDVYFSFEKKFPKKPSKAPLTGTLNNLVVYIRFADDAEISTTRQTYDDKFNPTTGNTLKAYYQEVSYNNLTINSTHYPACANTTNLSYKDAKPRNYYLPYNATTNPTGYNGDSERGDREHTLLVNAINWINSNSAIPAGLSIDADGDGNVDNVCFVIKGNSGGWSELLWAHRWSLYSQTVSINGKRVFDYTFQPENQVNVYVLCHEMFHALGAPDLYHYTDNGISPVGAWDLMESGSGHMLAYMKWKYSNNLWIKSIPEITTTGTYTLNPITSSTNNCYKIASTDPNQYFVLEYRKKTASGTFEANIPGSGLIVYRVDTRENGNADGPPDEVYIYRPGGTRTVDGSISSAHFFSPTRTAINDATSPSCFLQDGSAGGLNISAVTTPDATISFNVTLCTPTTQATSFTSSSITNNSLTVGFNRGNGNKVIVVARKGSSVNADPSSGVTYTANSVFGSGTELGTGNYVVYDGTASSVNVANLAPGTSYHFAVYEYGTATNCYKTPALSGNATTTGAAPCTVCVPTSISDDATGITNVAFNTINSTSTGNNAYTDNSATITTVNKGQTYPLSVKINTAGNYTNQTKAWIDWNQDCTFDSATEEFILGNVTNVSDGLTANSPLSILIPATALTGNTKMRIRSTYNMAPTSCGNQSYSEAEDYTIIVTAGCMPVAITTQPTDSQNACVPGGASFTVAAVAETAPITYQWQFYNGTTWNSVVNGTPAGATYTNATSETMTVMGITAVETHQFRCYLTNCSAANNATSTTASLVVNATPTAPTVDTITQPTCAASTGSVVLNGLPATGSWMLIRTPGADTITGSGVTTTITGLSSGTYAFTVINDVSCESVASPNVVINVQPATPTAGIINNAGTAELTCAKTAINVTATGGDGYSWSGGESVASDTNWFTLDGVYTVTVTGGNGCTATHSITITKDVTIPTAGITNNTGETEVSCTTPSISVTATGGISYSWSGGQSLTTDTNRFSSNNTYTVTVTGTNGCTGTSSIGITQDTVIPKASFTYNQAQMKVLFVNNSSNGISYLWDFGVGSANSSEANPEYTYPNPGQYTVVLTASKGACSIANSQVVQVTVDDQFQNRTVVYPNPSIGMINIRNTQLINSTPQVKIYDVVGKMVFSDNEVIVDSDGLFQLDLGTLAPGTYMIKVEFANEVVNQPLIIQK